MENLEAIGNERKLLVGESKKMSDKKRNSNWMRAKKCHRQKKKKIQTIVNMILRYMTFVLIFIEQKFHLIIVRTEGWMDGIKDKTLEG